MVPVSRSWLIASCLAGHWPRSDHPLADFCSPWLPNVWAMEQIQLRPASQTAEAAAIPRSRPPTAYEAALSTRPPSLPEAGRRIRSARASVAIMVVLDVAMLLMILRLAAMA